MTKSESAKVVAILLAAYPNAQVNRATSELYERMLADLDRNAASAAVERLVSTMKFIPTIAEIRAAAAEVLHGRQRLGGEAWGDVVASIASFGAYRAPRFADPLVEEAVRLLGWRNLCLSTNETADRARFIELYEGLTEKRHTAIVTSKGLPPLDRPPAPRLAGMKPVGSGRRLPEARRS